MSEQWYKDGLQFSCARCGYCCTFPGGYVWLSREEIRRMADHLGLSIQQFGKKYLRRVHGRYSLTEKANGHCVMYENGGCKLYKVRPTQCSTFPFWPENLRTPEDWKRVGKTCQGLNQGRHYSQEQIDFLKQS